MLAQASSLCSALWGRCMAGQPLKQHHHLRLTQHGSKPKFMMGSEGSLFFQHNLEDILLRLLGSFLMSSVTLLSCLVMKSRMFYLMCFNLFSCLLTLSFSWPFFDPMVLPHPVCPSFSRTLHHVERKRRRGDCFLETGLTLVHLKKT